MENTINELKKFDRSQSQLALYFLFEYGKQTLLNNEEVAKIKNDFKENNKNKKPILSTAYLQDTIDIARIMAGFSVNELSRFIYDDVKEQKSQERGR